MKKKKYRVKYTPESQQVEIILEKQKQQNILYGEIFGPKDVLPLRQSESGFSFNIMHIVKDSKTSDD
jgi:hypothetical protein